MPPEPHACISPAEHSPSLRHALHPDHVPEFVSHVRVRVPQSPHASVLAPVQVCPVQAAPQRHMPPHTRSPPLPHVLIVFGMHSPSPKHALQSEYSPVIMSHVRVCVPHKPHARRAGPSQVCPVHATSQRQLPPHVWSPSRPQGCVESGRHSPSPSHSPQSDHTAVVASHVRERVPQLPHGSLAGPVQTCIVQSPQSQLPMQT
jgi:hypothetical protein